MDVYTNLKENNIITENEDGSISVNHYELSNITRENEQRALNTQKENEHISYTTYNIIAISSFIVLLIVTFLIAFHLGKKIKEKK